MKELTELKMVYELVISRANLLDKGYQHNQKNIYREETLQELCLGLHSMCVGTESKYFNGHTNIIYDFLIEGVKEYAKPLFSIPTHQFLFNVGSVKPKVIWMYCKLKSLNSRGFVIPNEELVYSAVVMSATYFK